MDNLFRPFVFKIKTLNAFECCYVALILAAVCLSLIMIPNAKKEMRLLDQMPNINPSTTPLKNDNELKASNFYSALPTSMQVKEILSRFYMEMESQELELSTMQFSLEESADMKFAIYRFSAPIYGDYLGVMQAVRNLLEKNPSLAMRNIQLTRENIKESAINADIDFAIYMIKD